MLTDPVTGEQFQVVTRAEWGARPARWSSRMARFDGSYSHHGVSSQQPARVIWKGYQSWHMDGNNWPDIGYSYGYDDNGVIYEGRGWTTTGAHTYGFNEVSLGYCYIGDSAKVPPPPKALRALWCLIRVGEQQWGRRGYVRDHREGGQISGSGTACPGSGLYGKAAQVHNGTPAPPAPAPRPPAPTPPPPRPIPTPPGVDLKMNKPVMMQEPANFPNGAIWLYYEGTPFRVHVKSPSDVSTWRFMGVELKQIDATTARFFRTYTQEVKCG